MTTSRRLLALVGASAAVTACSACGESPSPSNKAVRPSVSTDRRTASSYVGPAVKATWSSIKPPKRKGVNDTYDTDDTAPKRVEENDDYEVEAYGQKAGPQLTQTAVEFVEHYYAAAAAEDGKAGCALLQPELARATKYEASVDPPYLQGKTCPEVMRKIFRHRHRLIAEEAKRLEVTGVRYTALTVFIQLAFRGMREQRFMGLRRMPDGSLKLEAYIDSQYP